MKNKQQIEDDLLRIFPEVSTRTKWFKGTVDYIVHNSLFTNKELISIGEALKYDIEENMEDEEDREFKTTLLNNVKQLIRRT